VSKAIQQKELERTVSVVGAAIDKSAIRQQMTSEGVATTVVQSKCQCYQYFFFINDDLESMS
jgi:hypothetical protein